jgi:hypothetical protein
MLRQPCTLPGWRIGAHLESKGFPLPCFVACLCVTDSSSVRLYWRHWPLSPHRSNLDFAWTRLAIYTSRDLNSWSDISHFHTSDFISEFWTSHPHTPRMTEKYPPVLSSRLARPDRKWRSPHDQTISHKPMSFGTPSVPNCCRRLFFNYVWLFVLFIF